MGIKEFNKKFLFILVTMSILIAINFIIMLDYRSLPTISEKPDYGIEQSVFQHYITPGNSRILEFNIGNGYISPLENSIFYIANLWLILRGIDLVFLFIERQRSIYGS